MGKTRSGIQELQYKALDSIQDTLKLLPPLRQASIQRYLTYRIDKF